MRRRTARQPWLAYVPSLSSSLPLIFSIFYRTSSLHRPISVNLILRKCTRGFSPCKPTTSQMMPLFLDDTFALFSVVIPSSTHNVEYASHRSNYEQSNKRLPQALAASPELPVKPYLPTCGKGHHFHPLSTAGTILAFVPVK